MMAVNRGCFAADLKFVKVYSNFKKEISKCLNFLKNADFEFWPVPFVESLFLMSTIDTTEVSIESYVPERSLMAVLDFKCLELSLVSISCEKKWKLFTFYGCKLLQYINSPFNHFKRTFKIFEILDLTLSYYLFSNTQKNL